MGKQWKQWQTLFSWAPKSLQMVPATMKLKDACSLGKKKINLGSILKSRDIILPTKVPLVKAMVFIVVMYGCERWTIKKAECQRINAFELWCFWTEKTLESPLDCKEIKPVNPKGNHPWTYTGRTNAKAEAPILWPPDVKNWLFGKDSDAGRDWGQEEKVMPEDEMAGWHHRLNGREFEWTPGVGDWQGSLVCYIPWSCRVGHNWVTELNWTELNLIHEGSSLKTPHLLIPSHFGVKISINEY